MSAAPGNPQPKVFIVDDDPPVRESIALLVRSIGLEPEEYDSATEFLDAYEVDRPGCLVLDVRMPGMSGIELQKRLIAAGSTLPIIFITGHGDVPLAVQAIRAGALDFIEKPFRDQELLDRVQEALDQEAALRRRQREIEKLHERFAELTQREREVLDFVVRGEANKVIANRLGVSQRTVEIHRANVMRKTGAESLAALVRMAVHSREPAAG